MMNALYISLLNYNKKYQIGNIAYINEKQNDLNQEIIKLYKPIKKQMMTIQILDHILQSIINVLQVRISLFHTDIIGYLYLTNKMSAFEIINIVFNDEQLNAVINNQYVTDPRNIIRSKFIEYIYEYEEFKNNYDELIELAKTIEKSCYNAIIADCRESNNSPPRNWKSSEFIRIYNFKCGIFLKLLKKNSQTSMQYGNVLMNKILKKEIDIDNIGYLSEKEICPISQEKEKNIIDLRLRQKIDKKTSNLYKCPKCHKRECEYTVRQFRSSDESPTIVCKCTICGHKFKIN
jgi:DNA-directed RNA polymerase subunit M/transcription elongation factor TFIIS